MGDPGPAQGGLLVAGVGRLAGGALGRAGRAAADGRGAQGLSGDWRGARRLRAAEMSEMLLVLNCGSSIINFALFDFGREPRSRRPEWGGKIGGIGQPNATIDENGGAAQPVALESARTSAAPDAARRSAALDAAGPYHAALDLILERTRERLAGR